jgi:dienelactone hydrolase
MRRLLLARVMALVAMTLVSVPAIAETVHFRSSTTPPTPLQQRLARERGETIGQQPGVELSGELYRPAGHGPFPAVVMLHGCGGRFSRAVEDGSGADFTALGYVLLIVDSFGPRGVRHRCTGEGPPVDRIMDAYGALLYLAEQPFVDADRIAVVGYSQGAMVALSAVELNGAGTLFDRHFRTAIAYYPLCGDIAVGAPTVILIGELDDWTPARDCRNAVTRRTGEGSPVKLVVYPDAYHGFNFARDKPVTAFGHHIEYNEAAARAAWAETVSALRQAFGR